MPDLRQLCHLCGLLQGMHNEYAAPASCPQSSLLGLLGVRHLTLEAVVIGSMLLQASHHEGHDVVLYYSQSGGVCDCGCPEAWKNAGCCTSHRVRQGAHEHRQAFSTLPGLKHSQHPWTYACGTTPTGWLSCSWVCAAVEPAAWVTLAEWEQSLLEAAFRISFHLLAEADVVLGRLLSSLVRLCKAPCLRSVAVAAIADGRPTGWKPAASDLTWDRLQEAFPMLDNPEALLPSAGLRSLLEQAAFHNHEEVHGSAVACICLCRLWQALLRMHCVLQLQRCTRHTAQCRHRRRDNSHLKDTDNSMHCSATCSPPSWC